MDAKDCIPLVLCEIRERPVAQDSGVVHEDVEAAERRHGRLDECLRLVPVGDVVEARDRPAALLLDLAHDLGRRLLVIALARQAATDVVDDHRRAPGGEVERVCSPQPAARTRHDRDATLESSHQLALLSSRSNAIVGCSLPVSHTTLTRSPMTNPGLAVRPRNRGPSSSSTSATSYGGSRSGRTFIRTVVIE